jgi:hypothetical protein
MEFSKELISALREVWPSRQIVLNQNKLRVELERELDSAKYHVIGKITLPTKEDMILAKEDVNKIARIQKAYDLLMESIIEN